MTANHLREPSAALPSGGAFEALSPVSRGPKTAPPNPLAAEYARLLCDNRRLAQRLERAEAIIELQKKLRPFRAFRS
jgi:transposase